MISCMFSTIYKSSKIFRSLKYVKCGSMNRKIKTALDAMSRVGVSVLLLISTSRKSSYFFDNVLTIVFLLTHTCSPVQSTDNFGNRVCCQCSHPARPPHTELLSTPCNYPHPTTLSHTLIGHLQLSLITNNRYYVVGNSSTQLVFNFLTQLVGTGGMYRRGT